MASYPLTAKKGVNYLLAIDRVVENVWALSPKSQHVEQKFHSPVKRGENPLIKYPGTQLPHDGGFLSWTKEASGKRRLWYRATVGGQGIVRDVGLAYAGESDDGIDGFVIPDLGTFPGVTTTSGLSNIQYLAPDSKGMLSSPRVYWLQNKHICVYRKSGGTAVVESVDGGFTWNPLTDRLIHPVPGDTQPALLQRKDLTWILYSRPRMAYGLGFGTGLIDDGEQRRVAFTQLPAIDILYNEPLKTILQLDEADYARGWDQWYSFHPWQHESGVWLGIADLLVLNTRVACELLWSYDGYYWSRPSVRTTFLDVGAPSSWDQGMVFGSAGVDRVGDVDRGYYSGWSGGHEVPARQPGESISPQQPGRRHPGIGAWELRRDGWASWRFPLDGGVVSTIPVTVPSNATKLWLNVRSNGGFARVRLLDTSRRWPPGDSNPFGSLPGFDWCQSFFGDSVSTEVVWPGANVGSLQGQVVRIEVHAELADLFSFSFT